MDLQSKLSIISKQEELLVFERFTAKEAWELGNVLVEEAKRIKERPAISIRFINGFPIFQYGFEGTGLDHQNWMERKENTVRVKQMSSMKAAFILEANNMDLKQDWFMDPMEYSICGGGFPIKVKNVGIIGTIIVSGISVYGDHNLIIDALSKYLNISGVQKVEE